VAKPTGLAPQQLRALDRLKGLRALDGFYLAGGSAIAFHLKHRRSLDLDLFSHSRDADLRAVRDALAKEEDELEVIGETDAIVRLRFAGEPLDIVRYPYAPLEKPRRGPASFPVAGLRDLAAMKLAAIAKRGIRRDFWDLHEIVSKRFTLRVAAQAYVQRFGLAESDLYHVARSLTYFADAEKDPAYPAGLTPAKWTRICRFFTREAPSLLRP
jgi:hypothetical protein